MEIVQLVSIVVSISIVFLVVECIRRGILREKYALLWLLTSIGILVFSIYRHLLDLLAGVFGFYYPPAFLFVVGMGFLHIVALHFSIVISSLTEKNKKLAQELGILQEKVRMISAGTNQGRSLNNSDAGSDDVPLNKV